MILRGNFLKNRHAYISAQEPGIFHCHHYNTYLQAVIEDTSSYLNVYPILIESAQEIAFHQFSSHFQGKELSIEECKQCVEDYFRFCGFGLLDLAAATKEGGTVSLISDHYAVGWKSKFGQRAADQPGVSFFALGYSCGALEAIYALENGTLTGTQTQCIAKGDAQSSFLIQVAENPKKLGTSPQEGAFQTGEYQQAEGTSVDYLGIREALTNMPLEGTTSDGLIHAFGVLLTRMYANYYCLVSYRFLKEFEAKMGADGLEVASSLLTEAGHVCAFNTFGGIMQSAEWNALIKPMLSTKEDWVHGIVAAVNALGWGIWKIIELIPNEKLVIEITSAYESNTYIKKYGTSISPVSFLAKGGTAGVMNLVYYSNLTNEAISLDDATYKHLFSSEQGFQANQLKCRAQGDEVDLFEVTLKSE